MKNIYLTIILLVTLAAVASAQSRMTLADIISQGESGETYTVRGDLIGVYVSPHYPNVIFAKDDNGYAFPMSPAEGQAIYDQVENFDQSNWVKVVLPEGTNATTYLNKKIKTLTLTGQVNLQNAPCNPLGLTLTVGGSLPQTNGDFTYSPNTYCVANFVMQEMFLVKPQNQEYAKIHWAVYNAADKKFYVPASGNGTNGYNLGGSFEISMDLWEQQPKIDPNEVFQDGYVYEFPAIIEFRLGETFGLIIDPGFSGENNIFYAPRPGGQHRMGIGNAGQTPYYTDEDENKYYYNVIVYPLSLDTPGVITAVEQVEMERMVSGVTYVDMQGRVTKNPTEGMCIEVTRYTDGTTSTRKVVNN